MLNWRLCRVDAWVFAELAERTTAGRANDEEAQRARELYRGPLLGDACDAAWAQPCRERLEGLRRRLLDHLASSVAPDPGDRVANGKVVPLTMRRAALPTGG